MKRIICWITRHRWEYPLAEDGDGDTVYYRTCRRCGKREEGIWERKGITSEKMRELVRITLKSFPPPNFEVLGCFKLSDHFIEKK